jgi:hypothetical protein
LNFSGTSSDDTLIIATKSPSAIQCISWNPQQVNSTQTSVINRLGIMENDETGKEEYMCKKCALVTHLLS